MRAPFFSSHTQDEDAHSFVGYRNDTKDSRNDTNKVETTRHKKRQCHAKATTNDTQEDYCVKKDSLHTSTRHAHASHTGGIQDHARMSMIHPPIELGTVPERAPQSRRTRDRLAEGSWHIDAVLPPNSGEMVYEDLQPVAASIQGTFHRPSVNATLRTVQHRSFLW